MSRALLNDAKTHRRIEPFTAVTRAPAIRFLLHNQNYRGIRTWGAARQVRQSGTTKAVASPETAIRQTDETRRMVSEALWREAHEVNEAVGQRTSKPKSASRPTASRWLLAPFLQCGVCGGSMTTRPNIGTPHRYYACTNNHLLGKAKCSNGRMLRMDWVDKATLQIFERALMGPLVLATLEEYLDGLGRHRRIDPKHLKSEA